MSLPGEILEALVRALRSVPCHCGFNSIDCAPKDRIWIQCGPCKALHLYDQHLDSKVVIASHDGDD